MFESGFWNCMMITILEDLYFQVFDGWHPYPIFKVTREFVKCNQSCVVFFYFEFFFFHFECESTEHLFLLLFVIWQNGLVNAVSASLLCSPNFRDPHDRARVQLLTITGKVLVFDPEFVLKVSQQSFFLRWMGRELAVLNEMTYIFHVSNLIN